MKDYSSLQSPFYIDEYSSKTVNAYVANAVTNIGSYAFYDCEFKNISIPDSVTSIDAHAFWGCNNLTSVTFGENSQLLSIGERAFWGRNIISIDIPASVTSIDDWAFASCSNLTNIVIPSSVTSIGENAFYNCSKLANITIEGSPQIGEDAFENTAYYDNANNWQNKVLYIGHCLIQAKTTIETCIVKGETTVIAYRAFNNYTNLTSVTFEDPDGWYCTQTQNATSGTTLTLTDASQNATYLKFNLQQLLLVQKRLSFATNSQNKQAKMRLSRAQTHFLTSK